MRELGGLPASGTAREGAKCSYPEIKVPRRASFDPELVRSAIRCLRLCTCHPCFAPPLFLWAPGSAGLSHALEKACVAVGDLSVPWDTRGMVSP